MSMSPFSVVPSERHEIEQASGEIATFPIVQQGGESPAARAARLLAEAKSAADEQVHALEQALLTVAHLAAEIAVGGDAYPPGVREICRRLVDDSIWKTQALHNITGTSRTRRR